MNPPIFIAFEGLDGSGKTTAARLTAEALGAHFMTTPTEAVRQHREEIIDGFDGSQEAAQLFYLATVFDASSQIKKRLAEGQSIVLDRYFLSTVVYAEHRGSVLELDGLQRHLLPADLTVFLTAPLEVRRTRVGIRGASAEDRETLSVEADAALREGHLRRSRLDVVGEVLIIDSSLKTPEQIVAEILAAITQGAG